MAITLGDAIVYFRGDTTHVDRAMAETERNTKGWASRVGGFVSNALNTATGMLMAQGVQRIGGAIQGTISDAFDAVASYERMAMSLETLTARELKNADAGLSMADALKQAKPQAKELFGWVQKLAIKSPFSQEDVADAMQMSMAFGFSVEESKRLNQALINFAAGAGKAPDKMKLIALALGQIKAAGKLTGAELRQLTENGIPVLDILARAWGTTSGKIKEDIEDGAISATDAIEIITESLEDDFAGAAERSATSLSGLSSSLQDLKSISLRNLFEGAFQAVQPYIASIVDKISSPQFQEALSQFGLKFGKVVSGIGELLSTGQPNNLFFALGLPPETVTQYEKLAGIFNNLVGITQQEGLVGLGQYIAGQLQIEWVQSIWPELQTWPDKFWAWLTDPEKGVLAEATVELDKIPAKIKEWSAGIDWQGVGGDIGEAILGGITGKMGEDESGKETISAFLKSLAKAVLTLDVELYKAGQNIAYGLGEKITQNIQSDFVRDMIKNGLSSLLGSLSPFTVFTPAVQGAQQAGILPEFAYGGVVPGPVGAPVIAKVHGGETIIPPGGSAAVQEVRITINTLNLNGVQDVSGFLAELEALS